MNVIRENISIPSLDEYQIGGILYKPEETTISTNFVLFGSATGIKCSYYSKLATYLSEKGYTVLLFDYTGIGLSLNQPLRKVKTNMEDWGYIDLQSVVNWMTNNFKNYKYYYLGHSVGGQIIGLLENPNIFEKFILVASQNGYWRFYTKRKYLYAIAYRTLWPFLAKAFGYFPSKRMIGENLPKGVALQWVKWLKSRNYLFDHIDSSGYNMLTKPVLAYSFSDDHYATAPAVEDLLKHYPNAQVMFKHYKPEDLGKSKIGHFGFFRESNKEVLWSQIHNFFSS
jgi:predicted alpha/beta hydrolase